MNEQFPKVYSDFILHKQPSTIEEAVEVYEKISQNMGNSGNQFQKASSLYAKLVPLNMVG